MELSTRYQLTILTFSNRIAVVQLLDFFVAVVTSSIVCPDDLFSASTKILSLLFCNVLAHFKI